jgi:hypothetical protein
MLIEQKDNLINGYTVTYNRNDGKNHSLLVPTQPNIGLDSDVRHSLVAILNHTLANEAVLARKTRSAHWNVSGDGLLELRILFNSQSAVTERTKNQTPGSLI